MVIEMTKQFMVSLMLLVTLVAPASLGPLEAAHSETVLAPTNLRNSDTNAGEVDVLTETDELDEFLASFSQWLDKFLDSDANRNTSVISIWNH